VGYPKNDDENRFELASKIASGWSREDLEAYVIQALEDDYRYAPIIFDETWDARKDSFEWSPQMLEGATDDYWQTKDALEGRR
jgi:hypothetical protein